MVFLKFQDFINEEYKDISLINEIGDLDNSYKYKKSPIEHNETIYYFTTKNKRNYRVNAKFQGPILVIDFSIIDKKGNKDWSVIINDNDYRVFPTIFTIIKKITEEDKSIHYLQYNPTQNFKGDKRREKIYSYYIEKNFDIKSYVNYGENIIIKIR